VKYSWAISANAPSPSTTSLSFFVMPANHDVFARQPSGEFYYSTRPPETPSTSTSGTPTSTRRDEPGYTQPVTSVPPFVKAIHFQNFRVLRKAMLPLDRFALLIGPNGSGKTTAMLALQCLAQASLALLNTSHLSGVSFDRLASVFARNDRTSPVEVSVEWSDVPWLMKWTLSREGGQSFQPVDHMGQSPRGLDPTDLSTHLKMLAGFQIFSLDSHSIAAPVGLEPRIQLGPGGENLAGVLDRLRDEAPETFRAFNDEVQRCLPDFDQILFETPSSGKRAFVLRSRQGGYKISAQDLSQGTLFLIAILAIAYGPEPLSIVCFEEPDRGIHPRLLPEIRDALYRLSHPELVGAQRQAIQVIVTTHSPYFLDVYRDHPEAIVVAEKTESGARFERLADREELAELLRDTHLGDAWYSGALGGVPADS
jgi:predicted ATPase